MENSNLIEIKTPMCLTDELFLLWRPLWQKLEYKDNQLIQVLYSDMSIAKYEIVDNQIKIINFESNFSLN